MNIQTINKWTNSFNQFLSKYGKYLLLIGICLLFVMPFLPIATFLVMRISVLVMIYSTLALALNILTGYTGLVSIGHVMFFGFGAYTSALLVTKLNINFFIAFFIAILLSALLGVLASLPTLRLGGAYLSIATLGFAEVFKIILINWKNITNGVMGVKNIPRPEIFGLTLTPENKGLYFLILIIMLVSSIICYLIINSKIGRAFRSIKEDELAATLMGINTTYYKTLAFSVSAGITGAVGAYYAHFMRYIDPNTFTIDTSILILSMVILGGLGTMRGMYLGAFILVLLPQISRWLESYRFVIYGLILILIMEFRPQGLLGWEPKSPYRFPKGVKTNENETV